MSAAIPTSVKLPTMYSDKRPRLHPSAKLPKVLCAYCFSELESTSASQLWHPECWSLARPWL